MDRQELVRTLAAMTQAEYDGVVNEARGDDPQVLKEAAAAALRRKARGHNVTDTTDMSVEESRAALTEIFKKGLR